MSQDAGVEITEMNSGCICCTLVGDFSRALQKVLDDYRPDRVIIEPSGVGKLSDVVKAIEDLQDGANIKIDGKITVVDGKKAKLYLKNFGEFFVNQVENASTIVISRTQMMTEEKIEECVHLLREENSDAAIITTPWDELSKESVLRALEQDAEIAELLHAQRAQETGCCGHGHHHEHEKDCGCHGHHHEHGEDCGCHGHHHEHGEDCGCHGHHHDHEGHHHADDIFASWGKETVHKYTETEVDFILKALSEAAGYGTILRAKGIVPMEDGSWKQFDMVPGEYEIRRGTPDYTGRICVIGTDLQEEQLSQLFHI